MRPWLILAVISIVVWLAGVYMVAHGAPELGGDVCRLGGAGFGLSVGLLVYKLYKKTSNAKTGPPQRPDEGK